MFTHSKYLLINFNNLCLARSGHCAPVQKLRGRSGCYGDWLKIDTWTALKRKINKGEEKMLSKKTYPVGLTILFVLWGMNYIPEYVLGIVAIFLIFGVYTIDLFRFLMAPKKSQKEFEGKVFVYALFDSLSPWGVGAVIMQPKPRENLTPQDDLWFEIEGKVTGKVAEKLNRGEEVFLTFD